ncbi:MAG: Tad domain-containing protein [Actinomycetota bacterium]
MRMPDLNAHRHSLKNRIGNETGAVLPIVAILIVVLLTFAAFAVDLGAAWAQRTTNQTAADAGVMAGGVSFIDNPPYANAGIVGEVERMADASLGYSISDGGLDIDGNPILGGGRWAGCVDPEVTAGNFASLTGTDGTVINPCVSLKVGATEQGEKVLRVYLPDQPVPTSFARVIGVNEISTSAFAEATLKFEIAGGALPFVLPGDAGDEYCVGEMPPGLTNSPCDGSNTGKRGDVTSPWHGTDDPGTPACTGDSTDPDLLGWNIALGIDHILRKAGGDDLDPAWPPAAGADVCAARDNGVIPYALILGSGGENENMIQGMAGVNQFGTFANDPGRLRQGPTATRFIDGGTTDPAGMLLDNVGLWEYLEAGVEVIGGHCRSDHSDYADDGPKATARMLKCLETLPDGKTGVFSSALVSSPRFALVPKMWANQTTLDALTPGTATNIQEFVPVYLQSTFWNCDSVECNLRFQDYEDVDEDLTNDRSWFAPGEGDADACLLSAETGSPKCKLSPNISFIGMSVFVLDRSWVPAEAFQGGPHEDQPVSVTLSR